MRATPLLVLALAGLLAPTTGASLPTDWPLLNPELDLIWMTEETIEEPDLVEFALETVFDSTGSVLPGLTEQEGDRPAAFWTYRAYSGEHHPHGQARGGAGRVAVVIDPRDSGPDKGVLVQAVGQRPYVGQWRDPTHVVVNVEAVYNHPVLLRAAFFSVEDPKIVKVSDVVRLMPFRGDEDVVLRFAPDQNGTMTEFMLVFEVDAFREAAILIDSIQTYGAVREIAHGLPPHTYLTPRE